MSRDLLSLSPLFKRAMWRLLRVFARDLTAGGAHLLARRVGDLTWWCDGRGRRVVADNLAPFVPTAEGRGRAVRGCYRAAADHLAFMLRLDRPRSPRSHRESDPGLVKIVDPWGVFAPAVSVDGGARIGGPLLLVTVHADWTRLLAALHDARLIADLAVIARPVGDAWADATLAQMSAHCGAPILPWNDVARAALRHLRSEGVLGVLADRDYAGDGLVVHLAGRKWRVPTGPAKLAAASGAPLVPLAWIAGTIVVGRPLRVGFDGDVIAVTRALARFQAQVLAASPARWVAFHQMWET